MLVTNELKLKTSDRFTLGKFDEDDPNSDYAFRFLTFEDLDEKWKDDISSHLIFRVYAVDSLSGLGKMHSKIYRVKKVAIEDGDFSYGNSTEIHPR